MLTASSIVYKALGRVVGGLQARTDIAVETEASIVASGNVALVVAVGADHVVIRLEAHLTGSNSN